MAERTAGDALGTDAASKLAIVVLGMHRSGTSAFARTMSLLGAELPDRLLEPGRWNEKGFWEPTDVVDLNDRILSTLGEAWDSFTSLPELPAGQFDAFVGDARAIITREYAGKSTIVLKEPRLCRLFPIWRAALESGGYEVKCVIPVRNPVEIAESLRVRDGFSATKSYLLWLRYWLDIAEHTKTVPRVVVSFDALLNRTREVLEQLVVSIPLQPSRPLGVIETEVIGFLSTGLKHWNASWEEFLGSTAIAPPLKQIAEAVLEWCQDPTGPAGPLFSKVAETWRESEVLFGTVVTELARVQRGHDAIVAGLAAELDEERRRIERLEITIKDLGVMMEALNNTVASREYRIAQLEDVVSIRERVIEQMLSSTSWRVTRPLRRIAEWRQGK